MVVEVDSDHAVPWMSPKRRNGADHYEFEIGSRAAASGSLNAVFVDGSVRSLHAAEITEESLKAMISIAGNDDAIARKADQ